MIDCRSVTLDDEKLKAKATEAMRHRPPLPLLCTPEQARSLPIHVFDVVPIITDATSTTWLADAIAARTTELQQQVRDHVDAHLPPSEREALASIAAGLMEKRTFLGELTEAEQGVVVGLIMARDWTMRATALGGEVAARCAACTSAEELAAVSVDLASLGEPPRVTSGEVALALRGA